MSDDGARQGPSTAAGCLAVLIPLVVAGALLAVIFAWNVNGAG
jgi:hypothetical protein